MKRILISRTDSIGDVVLTLPTAGVLKRHLPHCTLLFLGTSYTRPVSEACTWVDECFDWDAIRPLPLREQVEIFRTLRADAVIHLFPDSSITRLARLSGIPVRIASAHRFHTWSSCNRLIWFSRRRSRLHEAQLNLKLLKPLGIDVMLSREEIPEYYGLEPHPPAPPLIASPEYSGSQQEGRGVSVIPLLRRSAPRNDIDPGSRFKLILHPKSKGSAREWGLENFSRLITLLPVEQFRIFITGTQAEGELMQGFLERHRERVTDLTGRHTLPELMDFILNCDGMVAASTGPLHLAAAFGKSAIGLYAPMRPIWPARWAPLGKKASCLVTDKRCNDCRRGGECRCMKEIRAEEVAAMIRNDMNEHELRMP